MEKYEYITRYKTCNDFLGAGKLENYLNLMGNEGWQLAHVITANFKDDPHTIASYTFIFMRTRTATNNLGGGLLVAGKLD